MAISTETVAYTYSLPKFYSAEDVRKAVDDAGGFYFSPNTMRAFNSRLLFDFYPTKADRSAGYVVVSNKDDYGNQPREYNVVLFTAETYEREYDGRMKLRMDDDKQATFKSANGAKAEAKRLSKAALEAEVTA